MTRTPPAVLAVHPRAYGEQIVKASKLREVSGSPPCVRGAERRD